MSKGTANRRNLLVLGAGLAAVAGGWQLWLGREKPLSFQPIPGLPEWRQIAFGGVSSAGSAANAVFLGLDASETLPPLPPQALCHTLYSKAGQGIPAAIFTDVNCPNCASLEAKLKARSNALTLNWHDLPLLGPTSENAARAMAAGDLQSRGDHFRQQILNSNPGRLFPAVLAEIASRSGLDPERLLADMHSPSVDAILTQSRRAANTLGVWGTPGVTIGRTFVLGDMRDDVLDRLIKEEANFAGC